MTAVVINSCPQFERYAPLTRPPRKESPIKDVVVRTAIREDAGTLVRILVSATGKSPYVVEELDLQLRLGQPKIYRFVLAERDGLGIGFGSIRRATKITHLYCLKEEQHKGVGS